MSYLKEVKLGTSGTSITAFGQQKVSIDQSLLGMVWTYDVPKRGNKELIWNGTDHIEQPTFVNATSVEGALRLTSSDTLDQRTMLRSLQHVRYQSDRGYKYASSMILPDLTNRGTRRWGAFIPCNGVFLELVGNGTDYTLNFVVRNHWKDDRVDITSYIPEGANISKGNLWDIQMEWRGIGDYKVFFNLKLVYHHKYVGTLDKVHLENPSLPAGFECINQGDEVVLKSGCIDITSEGGAGEKRYYGSVSTGTSLITTTNTNDRGTAVIAFRLPKKINYGELVDPETGLPDAGGTNGVCYSRDTVLDAITSFCKDESFTIVSAARGVYVPNLAGIPTNSDPTLGWATSVDSYVEYMIGGVGTALEDAFALDVNSTRLVHSSRHEKDFSVTIPNPNPSTTPFFVTSDSYVLVSVKPDGTNQQAGVNVEFSEQI